MGLELRNPLRLLLAVGLAVILGLGGPANTLGAAGRTAPGPIAAAQDKGGDGQAPRALAGPRADRPDSPEKGRNKTWLTIAIIGGVAAAVLAAVLLLKKKAPKASETASTSVATTSVSTTTTPILPDTGSIRVESDPAGARILLDGADTAKTTPSVLAGVSVGSHALKVALARYQDWKTTVSVLKDQESTVSATLLAGDFTEDFTGSNAAFWLPATGNWTVSNGVYASNAFVPVTFASCEYALGDYEDYMMEVRGQVLRPTGGSGRMLGIVFRGAPGLGKYYIFQVSPGGSSPLWDVFEITNDRITRQYDPWQPTNVVREGWNSIKIVANGNTFDFYANGQLLGSRTIPEAPARGRVGLGYEVDINGSDVQFDDVALSIASGAPGSTVR
jgi:hypothetical protein